jgi:hypothetical protein
MMPFHPVAAKLAEFTRRGKPPEGWCDAARTPQQIPSEQGI